MTSWEIGLGLLGAAASLAGLAWNREALKKVTFVFLALLAVALVVRGIVYNHSIGRLQAQMADKIGNSIMSADQLYESVLAAEVTRPLFDDALNQAVDARLLSHRMTEFRTSENEYIRVRVYFKP